MSWVVIFMELCLLQQFLEALAKPEGFSLQKL